MIGWKTLFDLENDKELRDAIKLIEKLDSVYENLKKRVRKNVADLIKDQKKLTDALRSVKDSYEKLSPKTAKGRDEMAKMSNQVSLASAQFQAHKDKIKTLEAAVRELTKEQQKFNEKAKETIAIDRERERLELKLANASKTEAFEVAKLRVQLQEKNRQTKETAKEALGLVSLYQKESKRLIELRNNYKNVALAYGENSKQARVLQKELTVLDAKLKMVDSRAGQFQRKVGQYGNALSGLAGSAKSFLSAFGIVGGVTMFAYLIKDTFELIKESQSLNMALKQVTETTNAYAEQIRFLREMSDSYGINLNSLTGSYTKFYVATKKTNLEGEETQRIFSTVAKATSVMGLSAEDSEGALKALGQMISKGKVQAEELRGQLGDRLPGAFQIMAKGLGVTTSELDKMLKDGKLLADEVLPKFATQLEKAYGLDKIQKIETLRAAQTRLTNSWIEFIKSVEDGDGAISKVLQSLFEGMSGYLKILSAVNDGTLSWSEGLIALSSPLQMQIAQVKILAIESAKEAKQKEKLATAQSLYNKAFEKGIKTNEEFLASGILSETVKASKDNAEVLSLVAEMFNKMNPDPIEAYVENIETLTAKLKELQEQQETAGFADVGDINDQIARVQKSIKDFEDQSKISFGEGIKHIDGYVEIGVDKLSEIPTNIEKTTVKSLTKMQEWLGTVGASFTNWVDENLNFVNDFASNVVGIFDGIAARKNQQDEERLEALQEQREKELSIEGNSAEQKAAINRKFDREQEKIEKRQADRKRKIAIADKAIAVTRSIIDTASAVVKALAQGGFILGVPWAAAVGIAGAVQTAAILAQPIPQFYKGTDNAPGGIAWVGEKGREIVQEPSGKTYLTGDKPELRDIPSGSRILTNAITENILRSRDNNDSSAKKIQEVVKERSSGAISREMKLFLNRENDAIINGFKDAVSSIEVHQVFLKNGDFSKNVRKGTSTYIDVKGENEY